MHLLGIKDIKSLIISGEIASQLIFMILNRSAFVLHFFGLIFKIASSVGMGAKNRDKENQKILNILKAG